MTHVSRDISTCSHQTLTVVRLVTVTRLELSTLTPAAMLSPASANVNSTLKASGGSIFSACPSVCPSVCDGSALTHYS